MDWLPAILLFAAGLATGILLTWFLLVRRRALEAHLLESFRSLSSQALLQNAEQFLLLAKERLSGQAEAGGRELEGKKQLIDQRLEMMGGTLGEVKALIGGLSQANAALSAQVGASSAETRSLRETAARLQSILAGTQSRGQWGERIAEDILRSMGLQEGLHYLRQQTGAGEEGRSRPDYTFLLPQGQRLHMDVKFPLNNYLLAQQAEGEAARAGYRQQFWKDVRSRLGEVAKRGYIDPPRTLDYALAFIPNESIYAYLMEEGEARGESLLDVALQSRVILCSPFTLYAILAVIRQASLNFRLEEAAGEMQRLFGEFSKEWGSFSKCFDSLEEQLERAYQSLSALRTTRTRKLERVLARIESLRSADPGFTEAPSSNSAEAADSAPLDASPAMDLEEGNIPSRL